ncbi:MAG: YebC/PmpR family DNA-binding transcriptional regulator [Planctomycetia bacterium]|nr:YebC/PmpR family DNA-binding transcriptional regulator [Planctomycetia bacterium]
MAGHSHWSNIAAKKAIVDKKRGKLWSKLSKAIIIAARGGGDPAMNLKLRYAIDAAKAVSVPKDNIERAIKAGTGETKSDTLEEILYEGYGPNGVAVMCEILTDNRNRTAAEVRKIFELGGGQLGTTGCVGWMFERKGMFLVPTSQIAEDMLMELALEAGADDVQTLPEGHEITCSPNVFQAVSEALLAKGLKPEMSQISRIPKTTVELDADSGRTVLKLMENLDDHDDVQAVSSNFSIPDAAMAEINGG